MKKIILTLLFIITFSLILSPVFGEEKDKARALLERKPENAGTKAANLDNQRTQNINRVRTAVNARWNAYDKLIVRSGQLLDKLQIRIDKAKVAGQNTTEAELAMIDARAKLADAKAKMAEVKSLTGVAIDKKTFKDAQTKLQLIHKDLNIVRQDAAEIIKNLKSFNSEKVSTKSGKPNSSASAKDRD